MTDANGVEQRSAPTDRPDPEEWIPEDFENCRRRALRGEPRDPEEKREWLRAKMELVWAYRHGYGTEPDSRRYFELLAQVAKLEKGSETGAKYHLAFAFKEGIGTLANIDSYIHWMGRAAEDGDREAMFNLAEAYQKGTGGNPDESKYFYWISKMAAQGSPLALIKSAEAYKTGIGIQENKELFLENAKKAMKSATEALQSEPSGKDLASEDLPRAIELVSEAYRDGIGVTQSDVQYFHHLSLAVTAADEAVKDFDESEPGQLSELVKTLAPLKRKLSVAYLEAKGTPKDEKNAFEYMMTAAKNGDSVAMLEVARFYEYGIGRNKNRRRAFECYKKAAEMDNADGMYKAAIAYGTATGTKECPAEFQRLTQAAVRAGQDRAFMATELADLRRDGLVTASQISKVLDIFEGLRDDIHEIKSNRVLINSEATDGVAHFTTLEALHSMLPAAENRLSPTRVEKTNLLRLYNIEYVNDPQEGRSLIESDRHPSHPIRGLFPTLSRPNDHSSRAHTHDSLPLWGLPFSVYVGSFTLKSDRLDLWRAYGRDGCGFCLVTPIAAFSEQHRSNEHGFAGLAAVEEPNRQVPMTLYRVAYGEDEVTHALDRLKPRLDDLCAIRDKFAKSRHNGEIIKDKINLTARAILSDILYLYKNTEYENEKEVRLLAPYAISAQAVSADERTPAQLYVKTRPFLFSPESKIIIGPKVKNAEAVRLALRHRLDRNGHTGVYVECSRIPYR